ncbi:MAG: hypothetical protein Q7V19_00020 [Bacteroidales bacterium]|nr:hypothetical protein [Bacteroidales bacterium]
MKKTKLLKVLFFLALMVTFVACNKDKKKESELSAADAKVELRNATQKITNDMSLVMETPAMKSLNFLSSMMEMGDMKKIVGDLMILPGRRHLGEFKDLFRKDVSGNKKNLAIDDFGTYQFNFNIDDFELIQASENMLKLIYPADETAYANQQNNAELTISNIQMITIEYTETYWDEWAGVWVTETYEETIPTNANLEHKISGTTQMSGSYTASYTAAGRPTTMNAQLTMAPYQFQMSLTGSGTKYKSGLSFKNNNITMMGYDAEITYSSNMEDVEKVSGNCIVDPLKIQGFANAAAIDNHMMQGEENGNFDLGFLNSQIDLELIQVGLNAIIGNLEFKMFTDPYDNSKYPVLAIVYSDGSFEWLDSILELDTYKLRRVRK